MNNYTQYLSSILSYLLVPGPVSYLKYIANCKCNTSVVVSWDEPDNPNGVIIGYNIRYGEEEGSFIFNRTVNSSTTKLELSEDFSEYTLSHM